MTLGRLVRNDKHAGSQSEGRFDELPAQPMRPIRLFFLRNPAWLLSGTVRGSQCIPSRDRQAFVEVRCVPSSTAAVRLSRLDLFDSADADKHGCRAVTENPARL